MKIRFDWLTFSLKIELSELNNLLHDFFDLSFDLFIPCRGRYMYSKGYFYENITVLTDNVNDDIGGICIDISGKGCTYLYSLDTFDFDDIFKKINSLGGNISRLDVALDCFDNELDYQNIVDAVSVHNYASRWKSVKVITSFNKGIKGLDVQFGSRRSDIMLRIYDKKAEQNSDLDYWCRLEFQLRHDLSHSFADTYLNRDKDIDFITLFIGVLQNYLRFIDRKYGPGNSDKCPTLPWWDEFISSCSRKCVILRHYVFVFILSLSWSFVQYIIKKNRNKFSTHSCSLLLF